MTCMNEKQTTDEVLQEMRKIKEDLARSMDFDVDRILEDARRKQKESGRQIVAPPAREDA
jgi:hypothetical protein